MPSLHRRPGSRGWFARCPATYVAMCHVFSESIESFQAGMARGGQDILADIANFTRIAPVIQISEVVVP